MSDPIVISGIGIASPLGLGRQAHWDALVGDVSALEPFALEVADPLPVHGGARMRYFEVAPFLKDRKMARLLGRASAFGYAATHLALEDADNVFAAVLDVFFGAHSFEMRVAFRLNLHEKLALRNHYIVARVEKF